MKERTKNLEISIVLREFFCVRGVAEILFCRCLLLAKVKWTEWKYPSHYTEPNTYAYKNIAYKHARTHPSNECLAYRSLCGGACFCMQNILSMQMWTTKNENNVLLKVEYLYTHCLVIFTSLHCCLRKIHSYKVKLCKHCIEKLHSNIRAQINFRVISMKITYAHDTYAALVFFFFFF